MVTIALLVIALVLVLAVVQQVGSSQRDMARVLVRVDDRRRRRR